MKIISWVKDHLSGYLADRRYNHILTLFQDNKYQFHEKEIESCIEHSRKFSFYRDRNLDKAVDRLDLFEACVLNRISQNRKK